VLVDTNFLNFSIKNKLEVFAFMWSSIVTPLSLTIPSFLYSPLRLLGGALHDGLPVREMHALRHRLRHGRTWETGLQISGKKEKQ